jgi:hypothetical protein
VRHSEKLPWCMGGKGGVVTGLYHWVITYKFQNYKHCVLDMASACVQRLWGRGTSCSTLAVAQTVLGL